jgi:hypothetical protein
MLSRSDDEVFLKFFVFSDEATFDVSGKVNQNTHRIWGNENPQEVMEHERGTPKSNEWCNLTSDFLTGPFIFEEFAVTCCKLCSHTFTATVELPARWSPSTLSQASESLSRSAVCRRILWERELCHVAPRSRDLMPLDFFPLGVHKGLSVPNEGVKYG